MFAVCLRRHQAIDKLLVGIRRLVIEKSLDLLRARRQPGHIQRQAPQQRPAIRLGRGFQTGGSELREHELVNRISHPLSVLNLWRLGTAWRHERPMLLPLRALLDPFPNRADLFIRERLVRVFGRHAPCCVFVGDTLVDETLLRVARHDRHARRALAKRAFADIQAQIHHPSRRVRTVALEAGVRQRRPDLPLEVDRRGYDANSP